jgi:hypothetical protein|nr:MAG TPA: hypothetical protein [Caudoviricetes sp.]
MPSFREAKRIYGSNLTIGQQLKQMSDMAMEETWDNNIQSKVCYIYDYYHDNQPDKKDHMTYERTTKTRIDAKFIVKSYQSIDKDQVDYYIQFKPSQPVEFTKNDQLYYYEQDFRRKYGAEFPTGLYCDIPDEKGVYRKWMIILSEPANQFTKYLVLPINYNFMWIERNGKERIKRRMWAVLRSQNSYNSGLWTDLRFTTQENQDKVLLPLNSITDKIWYTDDQSKTMRVLVSAFTDHPIAWKISKVENSQPLGIQRLTLYQTFFEQNHDYIEKDSDGYIIGMWADYFSDGVTPTDPSTPTFLPSVYSKISASTDSLKVGGSYKTLTLNIFKDSDDDITKEYSDATFTWSCSIGDEDWTDKVTWRPAAYNQMKVKFPDDRSQLTKLITFKCTVIKGDISFDSEPLQLQLIV